MLAEFETYQKKKQMLKEYIAEQNSRLITYFENDPFIQETTENILTAKERLEELKDEHYITN